MAKLSKKELRTPDQVWQASAQTYRWLKSNWILSVLVVGLGFIFLVGIIYVQQLQRKTESEAQAVYGELASLFEQWLLAETAAKAEIETKMTAPLGKLADQYSETDSNRLASLYRARLKLAKDERTAAIEDLSHYEKALPKTQKALALYPRAIVREELEQWEEALKDYNQILKSKSDIEFRKWALLGKARSLTQLQKKEEASKTYDEFLSEFPSAPEVSLARGLKARLGI